MVCSFLEPVVDSMKCILVLVALTLYRVIMFIVFLSASVGPATLVCYLYTGVTGRDTYVEVQPAIAMMLISCWAEFSIGIEKRFCGSIVEHFKDGYPSVMSIGRFTVHLAMYLVAFCELYLSFEKLHTIPEPHKSHNPLFHVRIRHHFPEETTITSEEERLNQARENEATYVTIFLFALSYLVFITSRSFHKNLLLVVRNLPFVTISMLNNWLIRIAFATIHVIVNTFYFLPCLAIAYTSANYRSAGLTTFFQLVFTGGMSGMIAALFELNRPWPQRRGHLPFLCYENNIFGKNLLAHVLVVGILYFFYRPKTTNPNKVLESKFDSTNTDVLNFSLIVAFTTLHVVKFGFHAILSLANDYDDHRMHAMYNDVAIDLPLDRGSNSSSRNVGLRNDVMEEGEMCPRCIANVLNNNSPLSAPPNANHQNNDSSFVQPQQPGEPGQGRVKEESALEPKNDSLKESKDNRNTETTAGDDGKRQFKEDACGNKAEASFDTVIKISTSTINECQRHQSCKNSKVDLHTVTENDTEIHCS